MEFFMSHSTIRLLSGFLASLVLFQPLAEAVPLADALARANTAKSPFAALELSRLPRMGSQPIVNGINNLGMVIGFDTPGSIYNPGGEGTLQTSGEGFVIQADGSVQHMTELFGVNFVPFAINDRGTLAGVQLTLDASPPLKAVVANVGAPLKYVQTGLPSSFDQLFVQDINNNNVVLLKVVTLKNAGTSSSQALYTQRTFLASPDSAGNYSAVEVPLPSIDSVTNDYTPLTAARPNNYQLSPQIAGLHSMFLSDDNSIFGSRVSRYDFFGPGFRYNTSSGANYFYPDSGPVTESAPTSGNASTPVSLGGNSTLLAAVSGLPVLIRASDGSLLPNNLSGLDSYSAVAVSQSQDVLGLSNSFVAIAHPNGTVENISCQLPQSLRITLDGSPIAMNDTGWLLASGENLDSKSDRGPILLVPNPSGVTKKNYCTSIKASFQNSCGRNLDRYGYYTFKKGSNCRLKFEIRDSRNKPIANVRATLTNGDGTVLQSARTDRRGQGYFRRKFDPRSGSYTVSGPFADKFFQTAQTTLYVQSGN